LTGHIAKKLDCPVKNQTPGNPSNITYCILPLLMKTASAYAKLSYHSDLACCGFKTLLTALS